MAEDINIKIGLDTSGVDGKIGKLKQEFAGLQSKLTDNLLPEKEKNKILARMGEIKGEVSDLGKASKGLSGKGLEDMSSAADELAPGLKKAVTGMWGMVKAAAAFIATPIGAIIAVLAVAIGAIVVAFQKFQPLIELVRVAFAAVTQVVSVIIDRFAALGKALFEWDLGAVADAFSGVGDEMEREVALAIELEKRLIALEKAETDLILTQAQRETQMARLKNIAKDENYTLGERIVALKEAQKLEQSILDDQTKIQKAKVAQILQITDEVKLNETLIQLKTRQLKLDEIGQNLSTEKDRKEANEAIAKLFQLQTGSLSRQKEGITEIASLERQRTAEAENYLKTQKEISDIITNSYLSLASVYSDLNTANLDNMIKNTEILNKNQISTLKYLESLDLSKLSIEEATEIIRKKGKLEEDINKTNIDLVNQNYDLVINNLKLEKEAKLNAVKEELKTNEGLIIEKTKTLVDGLNKERDAKLRNTTEAIALQNLENDLAAKGISGRGLLYNAEWKAASAAAINASKSIHDDYNKQINQTYESDIKFNKEVNKYKTLLNETYNQKQATAEEDKLNKIYDLNVNQIMKSDALEADRRLRQLQLEAQYIQNKLSLNEDGLNASQELYDKQPFTNKEELEKQKMYEENLVKERIKLLEDYYAVQTKLAGDNAETVKAIEIQKNRDITATMEVHQKRFIDKLKDLIIKNTEYITDTLNGLFDAFANNLANSNDALISNLNHALDEYITSSSEALQTQYDMGVISEEQYNDRIEALEEERKAQDLAIRTEEFERSKSAALVQLAIDSATGIIKTIANLGMPAAIPAIAALGVVSAAQTSVINSQEPPKFGNGGYISGSSHRQGGVNINAEGGEFMINKHSMAIPAVDMIASFLNNVKPGANPMVNIGGGSSLSREDLDYLADKINSKKVINVASETQAKFMEVDKVRNKAKY